MPVSENKTNKTNAPKTLFDTIFGVYTELYNYKLSIKDAIW